MQLYHWSIFKNDVCMQNHIKNLKTKTYQLNHTNQSPRSSWKCCRLRALVETKLNLRLWLQHLLLMITSVLLFRSTKHTNSSSRLNTQEKVCASFVLTYWSISVTRSQKMHHYAPLPAVALHDSKSHQLQLRSPRLQMLTTLASEAEPHTHPSRRLDSTPFFHEDQRYRCSDWNPATRNSSLGRNREFQWCQSSSPEEPLISPAYFAATYRSFLSFSLAFGDNETTTTCVWKIVFLCTNLRRRPTLWACSGKQCHAPQDPAWSFENYPQHALCELRKAPCSLSLLLFGNMFEGELFFSYGFKFQVEGFQVEVGYDG